MKFWIVLFCAILSVALAQPVVRKCYETPPTWSGYFREINYDAAPGQVGFRYANISYDRESMKIKIFEFERREGDERIERSIDLFLFNEKVRYRVDEGKCNKGTINETTFPDFGIPAGATFYGYDVLGSETEGPKGVGVDQFHRYSSEDRSKSYHGSYAPVGTDTAKVCIPILNSFVNTESRLPTQRMNIHTTYLNLTTAVSSDAFKIPKECTE